MFSKRVTSILLLVVIAFAIAIETTQAAKSSKKQKEKPIEKDDKSDEEEEETIHAVYMAAFGFAGLAVLTFVAYFASRMMCDEGHKEFLEAQAEKNAEKQSEQV